MWNMFKQRMLNTELDRYLKSYELKLQDLKKKRIINLKQWGLLFPVAKPEEWDVSLWCLLLGNICGISSPQDPTRPPPAEDVSMGADIVRLRLFRNELCHSADVRTETPQFETLWREISVVLLRLGHVEGADATLQDIIKNYKDGSFSSTEEHIKDSTMELKTWQTDDSMQDFHIIKTNLFELKQMVSQLGPNVFFSFVRDCDWLMTIMDKYGTEWIPKITSIMTDLEQMSINLRNMLKSDERFAAPLKSLEEIKVRMSGLRKNHVDTMTVLSKMTTKQDRILENQEIIMNDTSKMVRYMSAQRERPITHDEMVQTKEAGGYGDIDMGCGHLYDLSAYVDWLIKNGHYIMKCYRTKVDACLREWHISELREWLHWSTDTNAAYEASLSRNYIDAQADIKTCPSCSSYCRRDNDKNVHVRCLVCTNYEFCWNCMREWQSDRHHQGCSPATPNRPRNRV